MPLRKEEMRRRRELSEEVQEKFKARDVKRKRKGGGHLCTDGDTPPL